MRTPKVQFLLLLSALYALMLLGMPGCVTVKPDIPKMEINDLPSGYAAVFIAVTDDIPSSELQVQFSSRYNVFLKPNAINKIYLPEDWYTVELMRLTQDLDNMAMRYRFTAGEISRFVLLRKSEYEQDQAGGDVVQTVTYSFAASSKFGFDYMQQQHPYPVVQQIPQDLKED